MGVVCSNRTSININNPDIADVLKSTSMICKDEQLKIRKALIFNTSVSENTFNDLSTPLSGNTIKYKIGDLIGKGANAEVYQCLNMKTGELMAVKHFKLSNDPKKIERVYLNMTKEVSLLKQLSHENIIKYYQSDLSDDMKFINVLLEYVPGGSLKSLLEKYGPLDVSIIKNFSLQLLKGLQYLHQHKIVHRDLKSANILITSDGILKLGDFGSSKQFDGLDLELSKSVKGSPYWMPPEIIKKEGHGLSADIWSFGCVLIEMVTGRPPWSNMTADLSKVLFLIAKDGSYPDFPETNDVLYEVIVRCVRRDPGLRPTCEEILKMAFFDEELELL